MEREAAWKTYDEPASEAVEALASDYRDFISDNKTERACVTAAGAKAEAVGYRPLAEAVATGRALAPGDKVWATAQGKALVLVQLGESPLAAGMNILGAHMDSPGLQLKQNPLYEANGYAMQDPHY